MGPYVKEQTDFLHFLLDTEGELADLRVKSGGPKDPYPVSAVSSAKTCFLLLRMTNWM